VPHAVHHPGVAVHGNVGERPHPELTRVARAPDVGVDPGRDQVGAADRAAAVEAALHLDAVAHVPVADVQLAERADAGQVTKAVVQGHRLGPGAPEVIRVLQGEMVGQVQPGGGQAARPGARAHPAFVHEVAGRVHHHRLVEGRRPGLLASHDEAALGVVVGYAPCPQVAGPVVVRGHGVAFDAGLVPGRRPQQEVGPGVPAIQTDGHADTDEACLSVVVPPGDDLSRSRVGGGDGGFVGFCHAATDVDPNRGADAHRGRDRVALASRQAFEDPGPGHSADGEQCRQVGGRF